MSGPFLLEVEVELVFVFNLWYNATCRHIRCREVVFTMLAAAARCSRHFICYSSGLRNWITVFVVLDLIFTLDWGDWCFWEFETVII